MEWYNAWHQLSWSGSLAPIQWMFPLINTRVSSRDPHFVSPLVKHLRNIRRKELRKGNCNTSLALQERINMLIQENQLKAVKQQNKKNAPGSKEWWSTANIITGRSSHGAPISTFISPSDINAYFQSINSDTCTEYKSPHIIQVPDSCRIPTLSVYTVQQLLLNQKRTTSGPDRSGSGVTISSPSLQSSPIFSTVLSILQLFPKNGNQRMCRPCQNNSLSTLAISQTKIIMRLLEKWTGTRCVRSYRFGSICVRNGAQFHHGPDQVSAHLAQVARRRHQICQNILLRI